MRKAIKENIGLETTTVSLLPLFKELRYFWLCMVSILLSLFFPIAELQFLAISLITGAKWIAGSRNTVITIIERR
jgi:hypothetical protein